MESFQTFITESLDKPYKFKEVYPQPNARWGDNYNKNEPLHYQYKFEADSGKFVMNFKQRTKH